VIVPGPRFAAAKSDAELTLDSYGDEAAGTWES